MLLFPLPLILLIIIILGIKEHLWFLYIPITPAGKEGNEERSFSLRIYSMASIFILVIYTNTGRLGILLFWQEYKILKNNINKNIGFWEIQPGVTTRLSY